MTLRHFNDLAYEEMGEENSKTILFLHAKLLDKWIWKRQKEAYDKFFKGFHCIFLDLPNHGESLSEDDLTIEKSSKKVAEFINHLIDNKDIESISIVALGIGSSIAIEILNENPNAIDNLILSGLEIADYKEIESDSVTNGLAKAQSE
ncbi:MAG: alpha/beta hydrolase, partial [Methanobrevibacter sp.]|nr:alpha/beta hydrolase [Methanobrevibacter sp.]